MHEQSVDGTVSCNRAVFIKIIDRLTWNNMCIEDVFGNNFCYKGHNLEDSSNFKTVLAKSCQAPDTDCS